ncbi:MAG: hypothetical protein GTN49_10945 [candidate division Zixibacteria bacterium]|nr:hypothetical protein [candidate division Zixibacteria bacterium]
MLTKKGVFIIAGAFAFAALSSWAGPGSVISSFKVKEPGGPPFGAYRDADYVYVIHGMGSPGHLAMKYTPTGSYVGASNFQNCRFVPEDPDHSYLGSSYITLAAEAGVVTYRKAGGSPVRWDHVDLKETLGYAHRPGSPYYFVGVAPEWSDYDYVVYRFSTGGSLVSSFVSNYGSKLAATDRFARVAGEYLITFGGYGTCGVYDPGGSLVATFDQKAGWIYGGTAGPAYPAFYGTTLWALAMQGHRDNVVYQIDLGNWTEAVAPASLGRVKALFR